MNKFLNSRSTEFAGKTVIDCPAGSGVSSQRLKEFGANVLAFDLFPEFFKVEGLECQAADICKGLPVVDAVADMALCQEGLEHFSDQLKALKELARVLKPGGTLILTTPNYSSLKAKMSYLLCESERFSRMMAPNEIDSVWMKDASVSKDVYFGHIFLIGILKLRLLAILAGFRIRKVHFGKVTPTSVFLLPFIYPFIFLSNWQAYRKSLRNNKEISMKHKKRVYGEIFRLSVSPKILIDGSLFVEFEKTPDAEAEQLVKHWVGAT
jgi:SAM-dependent methyltransferase